MGTADTTGEEDHTKMGVIPRIIHEMFSRVQGEEQHTSYRIKATYLEIINEEVGEGNG